MIPLLALMIAATKGFAADLVAFMPPGWIGTFGEHISGGASPLLPFASTCSS